MAKETNHEFTELPSEVYFSNLNVHIHYAEACFETYFLLRFTNEEYDNARWEPIILEVSPVFWKLVKKSLLETSLIMLQGICEAYYKTKKFIDTHSDQILSKANRTMYSSCVEKMERGRKLLKTIELIRHKTIAHFEPEYFDKASDLYQEVNLNIEDMRTLVGILKTISIDISKILFNYTNVYTGVDDHIDVVRTIEYALVGYDQDPKNRPWQAQSIPSRKEAVTKIDN
ncbi:MAG: hypothetical protein EOM59_08760 [Clostridia bacterium]|nr:hypothetical protein [Clostridia bacterium]